MAGGGPLYKELILHKNIFFSYIEILGKKKLINFLYCVYRKFIPYIQISRKQYCQVTRKGQNKKNVS